LNGYVPERSEPRVPRRFKVSPLSVVAALVVNAPPSQAVEPPVQASPPPPAAILQTAPAPQTNDGGIGEEWVVSISDPYSPPSQRFSRSEFEPEKVERLVREIAAPVRILAVDVLGMQHQLAGLKAVGKRAP
jgi:hypothetical protein